MINTQKHKTMNIADREVLRENSQSQAIRVPVKLTNTLDEYFVEQGQLDPSQVHIYETEAKVDRNTVYTILPREVMQTLDLMIRSQRPVIIWDDGKQQIADFSESFKIELLGRHTHLGAIVLGDEVVLGRIALELLDLVVDEENRQVITNPAHPNGPVFRI